MTKPQLDKLTELIAQGYITLPLSNPPPDGNVLAQSPSGQVIVVAPDGTVTNRPKEAVES